jgi:hypothetical protein
MVTDEQILRLRQAARKGMALALAAAKAGMDRTTARKYRRLDRLPSEVRMEHTWRTREDPFAEVWPQLEEQLALHPGLEAKTLFQALQRQYPGRYADGQLRTLQRKVKQWRAEHGPAREVFFAQVHHPGRLAASDCTHCSDLGVTLQGSPFPHLVYHFVLTYSNWETGSVCFSESYESLSEGLQNALWELGGVPHLHRTDRLTAAVQPAGGPETFKRRYQALLSHYGLAAQAIQAGKGNENGDVEQSHRQFKRALDQALMLRDSRDFPGRDSYPAFLKGLFARLNAGRQARLAEEVPRLRPLPQRRLEACKRLRVRVEPGSTVRVEGNVYSVPSRLIGEWVEARLYAERVEVWYGQRRVEELARLRGRGKHRINYRHVIDWLVRKPGAFADYRYRADLFPSSRFRMAYDWLAGRQPARAAKEYLRILHLAARAGEADVEAALGALLDAGGPLDAGAVEGRLRQQGPNRPVTDVRVGPVDLAVYDALLDGKEAWDGEGQGREGDAGGLPEGAAPAGLPVGLRGTGPAGPAGDAGLPAVPADVGPTGVPGAAPQAGATAAARLAAAPGEELDGVGPQAPAAEGRAAGPDPVGGLVPGPARERVGLRPTRFGQDAPVERAGPGAGACGAEGELPPVRAAGAGAAGGQAGPEAACGAEAPGRLRGADPG